MKTLSPKELLLVKLIHMLSAGTLHEYGLSLEEVMEYIHKPIARKRNKNALELLDLEGEEFLREMQGYLSE